MNDIQRKALQDELKEQLTKQTRSRFMIVEDPDKQYTIDTSPIAEAMAAAIANLPQPEPLDLTPIAAAMKQLADAVTAANERADERAAATDAVLAELIKAIGEQKVVVPKDAIKVVMPATEKRGKRTFVVKHPGGGESEISEQ